MVGQEDFAGRNRVATEALASDDAQKAGVAVGLGGIERLEGKRGERRLQVGHLALQRRSVVDVKRSAEALGQIGNRDLANMKDFVFVVHRL